MVGTYCILCKTFLWRAGQSFDASLSSLSRSFHCRSGSFFSYGHDSCWTTNKQRRNNRGQKVVRFNWWSWHHPLRFLQAAVGWEQQLDKQCAGHAAVKDALSLCVMLTRARLRWSSSATLSQNMFQSNPQEPGRSHKTCENFKTACSIFTCMYCFSSAFRNDSFLSELFVYSWLRHLRYCHLTGMSLTVHIALTVKQLQTAINVLLRLLQTVIIYSKSAFRNKGNAHFPSTFPRRHGVLLDWEAGDGGRHASDSSTK